MFSDKEKSVSYWGGQWSKLGCQRCKENQEQTLCFQLWSDFGTCNAVSNGCVPSYRKLLRGKTLSNGNCRVMGVESLLTCSGLHFSVRKSSISFISKGWNILRQGGDWGRQVLITLFFLVWLNMNKRTTALHIPCTEILLQMQRQIQTLPAISFHQQAAILHVKVCSGWQEK